MSLLIYRVVMAACQVQRCRIRCKHSDVGTAGMLFNFNNLIVKNAKDTLNDNGILFSVDNSNNINLPTGVSFKTTANTNYTLSGILLPQTAISF